jgi:hypothetical protein
MYLKLETATAEARMVADQLFQIAIDDVNSARQASRRPSH